MVQKKFAMALINVIIIAFALFLIFIAAYFYFSFNTEINAVSSSLNLIRNAGNTETVAAIRANIAQASFLFTAQLSTFLAAIISLSIGLWYSIQLYRVERLGALLDPLTHLYNRKALFFELKRELRKSERYGHPTSVAVIDLDFFKRYNDSNGHVAGDRLLRRFAKILKENVREYDVFGRYGGEEFIIVFPETGVREAAKVCERVRKAMEETKFYGQEKMPFGKVTISVGIAEIRGKRKIKKETIIHNADKYLYKAKEQGRNRVIHE